MNRITSAIALPIISAGIIGGAALGLAGTASASTTSTAPSGPGHSFSPQVHAHPAPNAQPGWHNHHGAWHVAERQNR
ncbi:hypothetical protein [Mycolicibacterium brisbanense]